MIRALLLALVAFILPSSAFADCTEAVIRICRTDDNPAPYVESKPYYSAANGYCNIHEAVAPGDGRLCLYAGQGSDPVQTCTAGFEPVWPGNEVSIAIPDLSKGLPESGCMDGCEFVPEGYTVGTGFCDSSGQNCRAYFPGGHPRFTGRECVSDPNEGGSVPPPAEPSTDPKTPPTPSSPDPNAPPLEGCKSPTDSACRITDTPPGCVRKTAVAADGGVSEEITCTKTTCGPSKCKTVSSSVTNNWNSPAKFRSGLPPDSTTGVKTTQTDQPLYGGPDGGSPTGTPGSGGSGGTTPGTGSGNVDGGKVSQPGSYCYDNPSSPLCADQSGGCKEGQQTVGCMKPGVPSNEEVPKRNIDLTLKASPVTFGGGGHCPSPASVSIGGRMVNLTNPGPVCDALSTIGRPIVLLIAAFCGALIIFKGVEV